MTTDPTCPVQRRDHECGGTLEHDRFVCRADLDVLRRHLERLPELVTDLDVAFAKEAQFGASGGRSSERPAAFGYAAAEALWVLRSALGGNAWWVAGIRGHSPAVVSLRHGAYVLDGLDWISRHPDGWVVVDELLAAFGQAWRAIDRPVERRYAGVCHSFTAEQRIQSAIFGVDIDTCSTPLYAMSDSDVVECPGCGTVYEVQARRDAMLEQLRDHTLTAAEMSRAVDGLGVDVNADRIRQWKRRGLIAQAGLDQRARPLYRVGDVLDIVAGVNV